MPVRRGPDSDGGFRGLNAITVATPDMARAVAFYRALGFRLRLGGPDEEFTSPIAAQR